MLFSKTGLAAGSHTLQIVVSGTENPASSADTVVIDAINVPTAAQQADYFPAIPQQSGTSITLDGRDSRLLTANYDFAGQHLVYSTSELDHAGQHRRPLRWRCSTTRRAPTARPCCSTPASPRSRCCPAR